MNNPLPTDRPPFDVSHMSAAERAVVLSSLQILIIRRFFADMVLPGADDEPIDPETIHYVTGHIKNMDTCLRFNSKVIGRSRMDLLRRQAAQVMQEAKK